MYCCGVSGARSRSKELVVEGIDVPLVVDKNFEALDTLVAGERDTVIYATLIRRFFPGKKTKFPNGQTAWRGYGHMGCCSLLAIQAVIAVAPHSRQDLDYRSSPDQPQISKAGCSSQDLVSPWPYSDWLKVQHVADEQDSDSPFTNPKQVAADALRSLAKVDENTAASLKETRHSQGRAIYEVTTDSGKVRYMIVLYFLRLEPAANRMGRDSCVQIFLRKMVISSLP